VWRRNSLFELTGQAIPIGVERERLVMQNLRRTLE